MKRNNFEIEGEKDSFYISQVEKIKNTYGCPVINKKDLKNIVEAPLVSACEELYDKNIKTVSSSANKDCIEDEAYIIIDFDSLSERNKKKALGLGEKINDTKGEANVKISIPITESSTFSEVEQKFNEIASQFEKQPMVWADIRTLDEVKKIFRIEEDDTECKPEDFESAGYYYDKNSGLFYLSKEHFEKATEENFPKTEF